MERVDDPEVAALRAVTRRLHQAGDLEPPPLGAVERRARRLAVRRRGAGALAAVAALGIVAGGALARPGPGEEIRAGGTVPVGSTIPARPFDLIVWLHPNATPDQLDGMEQWLSDQPAVVRVAFITKEQAYEEFLHLFRDSPEMTGTVRPGELPTSFRVQVAGDRAEAARLADQARTMAGVREATAGG
jgi:hypothetical protein